MSSILTGGTPAETGSEYSDDESSIDITVGPDR